MESHIRNQYQGLHMIRRTVTRDAGYGQVAVIVSVRGNVFAPSGFEKCWRPA